PQLWNVLRGQMSLVGPRPERAVFVDEFQRDIPRYLERHGVKSGITGWAQVNGLRGDTSIEDRTRYDIWYVENWSVGLDLKILFLTAVRFLFHEDAY
ncbi:MAG: sugar transferase, partial [Gemmatimonadetes bacterium]|nr:sugar transferase [Gemmatimonadota bacterium]